MARNFLIILAEADSYWTELIAFDHFLSQHVHYSNPFNRIDKKTGPEKSLFVLQYNADNASATYLFYIHLYVRFSVWGINT